MATDMSDRSVLITGASRGIGAATARAFARRGARVALLARSREPIADLAGEIGDAAIAVPCDVGRYWEVATAVETALDSFGRLDTVVLNAGVIEPIGHLAEVDPDDWGRAIDTNLKGIYHGIRAALPGMLDAGGGTILSISSGAASRPLEGWSQYCTAKAGAMMLVRALDAEYRDAGIRAIALSPGTVATEMQREIKASGVNAISELDWSDHIPPEWPAEALVWLAGPAGDDHLGAEVSLRDPDIRRAVGVGD